MANQESGILKVLVPFGGAMLIFLGVFYNSLYYRSFGISINSFLEISEIVVLFLNKLILLLITTFSSMIVATKLKDSDREHYEEIQNLENNHKEGNIKGWLKIFWLKNQFFLMTISPLILIWVVFHFINQELLFFINGLIISMCASFFIGKSFRQIVSILERRLGFEISRAVDTLFLSFLLSLPVVFLWARFDVSGVKYLKLNSNISIQTIDGKLINDSNHYYIGNTRQYLFFYDQVANETSVYPMSDIKRISFGKSPSTK